MSAPNKSQNNDSKYHMKMAGEYAWKLRNSKKYIIPIYNIY